MEAARIERLDTDRHDCSAFNCGEISLDRWLQAMATLAGKRRGTSVHVATNGDDIIACYQMSSFQLEAEATPGLSSPSKPPLQAILVSHLAVDLRFQHRGLGTAVLLHALQVADRAASQLGARLVLAHAVGERAAAFCRSLGFRPLETDPHYLYLLTPDVRASLRGLILCA